MKLFAILILSRSVFSTIAQDCDHNLEACHDLGDIANITCSGAGTDCAIKNGDMTAGDDLDYLLEVPTITSINADLCRKKCKEHSQSVAENKCKFYRWENVSL